jgi:hypothetical protein
MNHSSVVGKGHGMARADKGVEQCNPLERRGLARGVPVMVVAGRFCEGSALDETHRVEIGRRFTPSTAGAADKLIDGDDARMFQLSGYLGLAQKALAQGLLDALVGVQVLESYGAAQSGIANQPDSADSAGGMQGHNFITRILGRRAGRGRSGRCRRLAASSRAARTKLLQPL